jgi:hypothetical protein
MSDEGGLQTTRKDVGVALPHCQWALNTRVIDMAVQWGHADEGVENAWTPNGESWAECASMGPRR